MKRPILTAILLASVMGVGSAQDVKREITQVTDPHR
jgi:hypothetical protein